MATALTELVQARGLLRNLVARDLNSRYKGSAFGIAWSLLNPLMLMAVYTVVFSTVVRFDPPGDVSYPMFFMAGFLPWTFFSMAVTLGAGTLVQNAGLIQKIWFPREVLPLSMSIAALVNMLIGLVAYLPFAYAIQGISVRGSLLLIPVTAALFVFGTAMAMLLSVITVYFRDTEFLLANLMTAWFFLSPVVYDVSDVPDEYEWLFRLNPVTPFVEAYRDVLVRVLMPRTTTLLACGAIALVTAAVALVVFRRLTGRIAEEL